VLVFYKLSSECEFAVSGHFEQEKHLKCYYDQKITFIFSSDFETMFIKHSPSEIISLNFEKKTVNLNCNFPV